MSFGAADPPGAPEEDAVEDVVPMGVATLTSDSLCRRVSHRGKSGKPIWTPPRPSLGSVASFHMAGLEDAAEDLLERLGDIG